MAKDETTDIFAAFLIGAALGIGATLLLKEDDETELQRLLKRVRLPRPRRGSAALAVAREHGGDLIRSGRRTAESLRGDAADIVAAAREEILGLARDGVKRVRRARAGR